MESAHQQFVNDVAFEDRTIHKAFNRIVVFVFILYIIAFIDRINIAFAALSMNKELKLTATTYGFAISIFFVGYAVCEIPSNMMLARYGARKWLARIMLTWGIATIACVFVAGARSLYVCRLIVGMAEAGFLPGVLLYLTYWFPPTFRARATAILLIAQPGATAVGAALSGLILDHTNGWLGYSGWRWLFVMEGLPALVFAFLTYVYLSDRPANASWLTDAEKVAIEGRLRREQGVLPAQQKVWREVVSRSVLMLALAYFGQVIALNASATWTPQIIRDVVKAHSFSFVGLLTALPAVVSMIAAPLWGSRSDKRLERTWHYSLPILLASFGWLVVGFAKAPDSRILGLILTSIGLFAGQSVFWAIVPNVLSPRARPVGIAFISMCGIFGSLISPVVIGFLRDLTHGWAAGLLFPAIMLVVSVAVVLILSVQQKAAVAVSQ